MRRLIVLTSLIVAVLCGTSVAADKISPGRVLEILKKTDRSHPYLILTEARLKELAKFHKSDKTLHGYVKDVVGRADNYLKKPMLKYEKRGPRLLHISRRCVNRIYALGLAYRITGDKKYAYKAIENMLAVCEFKDWNPSHFLDTAEMSHAVGVGYDWLYGLMDEKTREEIRNALIEKGLEAGWKVYKSNGWWVRSRFNWNQVCNGGMIIGALALWRESPQAASKIIAAGVNSYPRALKSYAPDGAWGEGPGYWHYATSYTAYGLCALRTAMKTDFGLSKAPGLDEAGMFPIYLTGPDGLLFNYADAGSSAYRHVGPMSCLFWLTRVYDEPTYAQFQHSLLKGRTASPEDVIWYVPEPKGNPLGKLAQAKYFRGSVEVATFQAPMFRGSAWDKNAIYLAVKAGYNQVNHGHLDLGQFVFNAQGVRWAVDLGADNYNLPGYWDSKEGGRRWDYYCLNSRSHNVPLIDGENQKAKGKSRIVKFSEKENFKGAIVDFTSAYSPHVKRAMRGAALVTERAGSSSQRTVAIIQDEFIPDKPVQITWGMTTEAKIDLDEDTAILKRDNKVICARILSPAGAKFTTESAEQKPPQRTCEGFRRLLIELPKTKKSVRIVVVLEPAWPFGRTPPPLPEVMPLAQWPGEETN